MDLRAALRRRSAWGRCAGALALHALPLLALAQAERFAPEQIEQGRQQYLRTCAPCHGFNMVNAGTTVYDLRRFPLEQRERFVASVSNGKGNMPSFKGALSDAEIDSLWAYIATRGKQ